jgi:DNA-binding MarR family transcriptional regulator
MPKIDEELNHRKGLDNAYGRAFYNLLFTQTWLQNRLRNVLADFDITYQQQNVLSILRDKHPEPLTSAEIKAAMLEKNSDLTRLCDRLEAKGYISRGSNHKNRRQILITVTPKGLEMLHTLEPLLLSHIDTLSGLTEEESHRLSDLLDKFRDERARAIE